MAPRKIRIPTHAMTIVKDYMAAGKKINAIKEVRKHAECGLRDAKLAVEVLSGETTSEIAGVYIAPTFRIKEIMLESEEGDVKVDFEELRLRFLMELPEIGIDAVGELLELVNFIKKWQGDA